MIQKFLNKYILEITFFIATCTALFHSYKQYSNLRPIDAVGIFVPLPLLSLFLLTRIFLELQNIHNNKFFYWVEQIIQFAVVALIAVGPLLFNFSNSSIWLYVLYFLGLLNSYLFLEFLILLYFKLRKNHIPLKLIIGIPLYMIFFSPLLIPSFWMSLLAAVSFVSGMGAL